MMRGGDGTDLPRQVWFDGRIKNTQTAFTERRENCAVADNIFELGVGSDTDAESVRSPRGRDQIGLAMRAPIWPRPMYPIFITILPIQIPSPPARRFRPEAEIDPSPALRFEYAYHPGRLRDWRRDRQRFERGDQR
jgi:hypothetical protein